MHGLLYYIRTQNCRICVKETKVGAWLVSLVFISFRAVSEVSVSWYVNFRVFLIKIFRKATS
jgi:hypothetical protein